jgi:large subunit ribosomal protein L31
MKNDIHPTYYSSIKVTCACGNTFVTGSTVESIQTEICAACHPFFTGKAKLIAAGQVDKFKARLEKAQDFKKPRTAKKPAAGPIIELKDQSTSEAIVPAEEETHEKSDTR